MRRKQVILKHQTALYAFIYTVQHVVFQGEIADIQLSQEVKKGSELHSLCPFLDKHKMLLVGGRLKNSSLPYEYQHQVIQPSRHHLIELTVRKKHKRLLHVGPQYFFASLQQEYWIPRGRQIIQSVLRKCLLCLKQKAVASQQLMGQFPTAQIHLARPFFNFGVHYAGPFYVKQRSPWSRIQVKCCYNFHLSSCQGSSS